MAWVGNHWVGVGRKFVFKGFLPQIVCVWGDLTFFCQGSLPLLSVVQEVGTLVGLVDQVGARLVRSGLEVVLLYLVARSPPQERRVRRKFCEGFVPGEVGVPGSLLKFFQGSPPRVCGCVCYGSPVACLHVHPIPLPKAAWVGQTFFWAPPPLIFNADCGGGEKNFARGSPLWFMGGGGSLLL